METRDKGIIRVCFKKKHKQSPCHGSFNLLLGCAGGFQTVLMLLAVYFSVTLTIVTDK